MKKLLSKSILLRMTEEVYQSIFKEAHKSMKTMTGYLLRIHDQNVNKTKGGN